MTTNQLHIGMIGVSGRGGLWRHWHDPQGRSVVVAGADVNPDYLRAFAEENGGDPFVTDDYRALLARPDIDAVAITTPDYCHEEHALAALEAGKHVFCEKPMAITIEGCDRILNAWQTSGVRLMIGFNMRYMNMFRVMKEIVDSGVIGEIKAVWVRHFVGHGSEFYYHDWHATQANGTSLLLQKGSHDIDMIHWITGRYTKRTAAFGSLDFFGGDKPNDLTCPTCPERDTCTEYVDSTRRNQCAFRQEVDVEDNQVMIMQLEGGIKASYTAMPLHARLPPQLHLHRHARAYGELGAGDEGLGQDAALQQRPRPGRPHLRRQAQQRRPRRGRSGHLPGLRRHVPGRQAAGRHAAGRPHERRGGRLRGRVHAQWGHAGGCAAAAGGVLRSMLDRTRIWRMGRMGADFFLG